MDRTKIKFLMVMGLAGASVVIMSMANKGIEFTIEMAVIATILSVAVGVLALVIIKRKQIAFLQNVREKPKTIPDEATRRLCGFSEFVAYNDCIIFKSESKKLTGHSYILLEKLPYMIEQMDKDTQYNITSSFSRLLGTFNHPFTYMPICRPVNRKKFMNDVQKRVHNIRIATAVSKVPDPKQEIEERRLMEQLKRLTEGENPIEILFLVQIRETRKTVPEIRAKLDSHSESMIDTLSVIHQVSARRLTGADMIDAIQSHFMLDV